MSVVVGVDVGGTTMIGGRVNAVGEVAGRVKRPRPNTAAAMWSEPLELVRELLTPEVEAIGLGVAGLVRWPEGELVWGPNTAGEGVPFKQMMIDAFDLPVVVDNDANAAAIGELHFGAARGHTHVILLTLGTGIGCGLIIDGRIYRGRSFAGEVGHLTLDASGPACTCGQRGCWETHVSGRRMDQIARELAHIDPDGALAAIAGGETPTGRHLTAAAAAGDPEARRRLHEVGYWLGLGLAGLIATFDPELILIGGAAAAAGDYLLDPARRTIVRFLEGGRHRQETPILVSHFEEDSAMMGAAVMALEARDV